MKVYTEILCYHVNISSPRRCMWTESIGTKLVGTNLGDLLNAASEKPSVFYEKGSLLGFEDENLQLDHPVTAADARRWTADEPLRLKFKVFLLVPPIFVFTMWTKDYGHSGCRNISPSTLMDTVMSLEGGHHQF
ncbi:hypothetical protein Plhal304r1_c017g0061771 [Plasmopara halstedii]